MTRKDLRELWLALLGEKRPMEVGKIKGCRGGLPWSQQVALIQRSLNFEGGIAEFAFREIAIYRERVRRAKARKRVRP